MTEQQSKKWEPGYYGTWSELPKEPFVEPVQATDDVVKNPKRRLLLKLLGVSGILCAEFGTAAVLRRAVENAKYVRDMSEKLYASRVERAAQFPHQDVIIYPDFENLDDPPDLWDTMDSVKQELGEVSAGIFCRLQDVESPEAMEKTRQYVRMIKHRGGKVIIGLGADSSILTNHPFSLDSELQMVDWMERWVIFLRSIHISIDVRFLFEMNVYSNGYVAYREDSRVNGAFHAERFKYLFSTFYDMVHAGDANGQDITVSVNATCDGQDLRSYVPPRFDGFGLNVFDFREGDAPIAPVNTLIGSANIDANVRSKIGQVNVIVDEYNKKAKKKAVKKIYELGSLHDEGFEEFFIAYVLSLGYQAIGFLDMDKRKSNRVTEKNWKLTPEKIEFLKKIYSSIAMTRATEKAMSTVIRVLFGESAISASHLQKSQ